MEHGYIQTLNMSHMNMVTLVMSLAESSYIVERMEASYHAGHILSNQLLQWNTRNMVTLKHEPYEHGYAGYVFLQMPQAVYDIGHVLNKQILQWNTRNMVTLKHEPYEHGYAGYVFGKCPKQYRVYDIGHVLSKQILQWNTRNMVTLKHEPYEHGTLVMFLANAPSSIESMTLVMF